MNANEGNTPYVGNIADIDANTILQSTARVECIILSKMKIVNLISRYDCLNFMI